MLKISIVSVTRIRQKTERNRQNNRTVKEAIINVFYDLKAILNVELKNNHAYYAFMTSYEKL